MFSTFYYGFSLYPSLLKSTLNGIQNHITEGLFMFQKVMSDLGQSQNLKNCVFTTMSGTPTIEFQMVL